MSRRKLATRFCDGMRVAVRSTDGALGGDLVSDRWREGIVARVGRARLDVFMLDAKRLENNLSPDDVVPWNEASR